MNKLSKKMAAVNEYPERILQFGEGNFLRAFVDWMVNGMNNAGKFGGKVVVVQPIPQGLVDTLNEQDGLYTLILRGIQSGEVIDQREVMTAVSRGINPYTEWQEYLNTAINPDMRFVISNSTEAGIAFIEETQPTTDCPTSFPAKLTAWLFARYQHFNGAKDKGMIILPCELIDRNGDKLYNCVLKYAELWNLNAGFTTWLNDSCAFMVTLVDRIVTGYPREEAETLCAELGYQDNLLDTGEIFHLWVIEGPEYVKNELPLTECGFNVIWTNNLEPYRTRKVRILNGAHTMTVPAAYLAGVETVRDSVEDGLISEYMKKGIFTEIIPTLDLPEDEKAQFAEDVLERFRNPFIRHLLLSIALNSVSKYSVRVLPSLLEYQKRTGKIPAALAFGLSALFCLYQGTEVENGALKCQRAGAEYFIKDDLDILVEFSEAWKKFYADQDADTFCRRLMSKTKWWGIDLTQVPGLLETVASGMYEIKQDGMRQALTTLLRE
ncbi:MAG: tagaturonate reductase [bacterium]